MALCCAPGCTHSEINGNCNFYRFPKDTERKRKWKILLRGEREPGPHDFLCSCHFPNNNPDDDPFYLNDDVQCTAVGDCQNVNNSMPGPENEIQDAEVSSGQDRQYDDDIVKRDDYLDWSEYFMATAFLAAKRSKDPVTQVGACIINKDKIIVGVGYNGMPNGCPDVDFPWGKSDDLLMSKHAYVCHAELNAVLNTNCSDIRGCTMYVGLFPCNECAKVIIQANIKEVIYMSDKHAHKPSTMAAKKMFEAAGVSFKPFKPRMNQILIDFNDV